MKKVFTLLFCLGTLTSVFAQYNQGGYDYPNRGNRNDNYDWKRNNQPPPPSSTTVILDRHDGRDGYGYDDHHFFDKRERDEQIARINWQYDAKMNAVQSNPYMGFFEKRRTLRQLQYERAQQIRMVYAQFSDRRGFDRDGRW